LDLRVKEQVKGLQMEREPESADKEVIVILGLRVQA
jgi:hypothetical protein